MVGEDNATIGVLLLDPNGAEEVCINMDLIRQGFAELDSANAVEDKQGTYIRLNLNEANHEKNTLFGICENKGTDQTVQLISVFVFSA